MSVALPRFASFLPALALALFSTAANAQVTLHLTTTQQTACDATTDSRGLSLVPGGTDLEATGVTLTGNGCGGGSSDFAALVSAPGTATVGTPFNVTWSASEAATVCTYGAPSSGVTGWPAGTLACQGAACAGSHNASVTINAAGTYNFGVTCTNSTGFAQSPAVVASVSNVPPTPNNFALVASASPTTGTPFTVSWAVTGATSCTGSASLNGNSANLSGWTDSTSATSPRNVTATTPGTYTLSLTCSNASGSVTSLPTQVVVTQGAGSCPASPRTRATISDIWYLPGTHIRHNVDLTHWENIWGHINETDSATLWPGIAGASPTIKTLGKTQYIAAAFHVDANVLSTLSGFYKNVSYGAGPNLDMAISQTCGDFAPAQAGCVQTDIPSNDSGLVYWRMVNGSNFYCQLAPNTDYYLNVQFHDVNATGPGCSGATCQATMQHNHN